jgi:hypothetical protein
MKRRVSRKGKSISRKPAGAGPVKNAKFKIVVSVRRGPFPDTASMARDKSQIRAKISHAKFKPGKGGKSYGVIMTYVKSLPSNTPTSAVSAHIKQGSPGAVVKVTKM